MKGTENKLLNLFYPNPAGPTVLKWGRNASLKSRKSLRVRHRMMNNADPLLLSPLHCIQINTLWFGRARHQVIPFSI